MKDIFSSVAMNQCAEDIREKKAFGGIFTPGLHQVTGMEVFFFDNEKFDFVEAEVVFTTESGDTFAESMRTEVKSNQTQADVFNYLYKVAMVSGKVNDIQKVISSTFNSKDVTHKTRFGDDVKAKKISLFANTKFTIMTYSELSGGANKIYCSQRVNLSQVFGNKDNVSPDEAQYKTPAGESFKYWSEDEARHHAKSSIKWAKDGRYENDPVLKEALVVLLNGVPFTKSVKEKLQDGFSAKEVINGTQNGKSAQAPESNVVVDPDVADEDIPF